MPEPVYTPETCPKSDTWLAEGGRCGWAHECAHCTKNPDKPKQ